jgi:hypothetical protein
MAKETEIKFETEKNIFSEDSQLLNKLNLIDTKYGKYITHSIPISNAASTLNYGVIFIARHPIEIIRISETHAVASASASLNIEKLEQGQALTLGTSLLTTAFDLTTTANIPVVKEGKDLIANRKLRENDRIGLVISGTLTGLSDLCITIYYKEILQDYIY